MINLLNFFKRKSSKTTSFFDLPAKEKKRIVKKAAMESNKMQRDLIERYRRLSSV